MKHEIHENNLSPAAMKTPASPPQDMGSANTWGNPDDKRPAYSMPAPPPVWTRYIDSRLKQFCTR